MAEPVKKLSRTQRILASQTPLAVARRARAAQAENPGKPIPSPVPPTQDEQDEVLTGKSKFRAPEQAAPQKRIGRPSGYTEERGKEICEKIAGGMHLSTMVGEGLVPSLAAFSRWMNENEAFREAVARAQEARAELWADQLIEIADTDEDANRARVRIDARWKVIGSLLYRRYGVKQSVDINQTVNVAVAHADTLLRLAERARQPSSDAIEVEYKEVTQ